MGTVLSIMNEKGGVGKTSLTFSCAWYLAEKGNRVLIIDMDGQQANISKVSGVRVTDSTKTMEDVLMRNEDVRNCIQNAAKFERGKIDIIPANAQMAALSSMAKISRMKKAVNECRGNYDYIFIDVNPSPDWRHALTLSVLNGVFVLMLPDVLSLEGVHGIFESIEEVQGSTNPNLSVAGVLFNQFDMRTRLGRAVLDKAEEVSKKYGVRVCNTLIRKSVTMSEAATTFQGITGYANGSLIAEDVRAFVDKYIG